MHQYEFRQYVQEINDERLPDGPERNTDGTRDGLFVCVLMRDMYLDRCGKRAAARLKGKQ